MKFSCTKDNLFGGLAATAHLSNKNINLPILNNVLVRAETKGIRLTSTNLEIAVTCSVRGKVDEEGEFTFPSKLFFDYINLLPNERIDMELDGDSLTVVCEKNRTKIKGIASSEFPLIPPISSETAYQVDGKEFRSALSQVLFATATNESRMELAGVLFRFHDSEAGKNSLVLAATDSYRLAERTFVLDDQGGDASPVSVIIPSRTLLEVSRVLSLFRDDLEAPERLEIRLSEAQVVFRYGSVELTSRIIDGHYPDYRQIVPKSFRTEATVRREDILKAAKTASLFSRTGLFDIHLVFDPSGAVTVKAEDATRGENTASCQGEVTGVENQMTVNYRYFLDGLNAISEEDITIGVNDASNPCLIRPKGKTGYLYLVMPIRQ